MCVVVEKGKAEESALQGSIETTASVHITKHFICLIQFPHLQNGNSGLTGLSWIFIN